LNFFVVGISHRVASLEVREKLAIAGSEIGRFCRALVDSGSVLGCFIVSTCNRVELYGVVTDSEAIEDSIGAAVEHIRMAHLPYYSHSNRDALSHLLSVSSSLDSMVVGEPQILGQMKEAFQLADEAGTIGSVLRNHFVQAFRTAKLVRTETAIGRAAVSVGHVAVELAKTIFGGLEGAKVLLIGAGKMGVLAAENLSRSGAGNVTVVNRTASRADRLAETHDWNSRDYGDLDILLAETDVVICATGSPQHVLTFARLKQVLRQRRYAPLFLIDIAVPRDIEPACGDLDNVYLYNIDDLESASQTNAEGRQKAVSAAQALIGKDLDDFAWQQRERVADPVIKQLKDKALSIARSEVPKAINRMNSPEQSDIAVIEKLAEVIAERIIRDPILALKRHRGEGGLEDLETMVSELFSLNGKGRLDD